MMPSVSKQKVILSRIKYITRHVAEKGRNHTTNPGNGGDKSEASKQRDEEIRKLQELRDRAIDNEFQQESIWKAMKERDELLRRKDDKKDKKDDNGDKKNGSL